MARLNRLAVTAVRWQVATILVMIGVLGLSSALHSPVVALTTMGERSIELASPKPLETTVHRFMVRPLAHDEELGSIVVEYCDNSPLYDDVCVAPVGLDVASGNLINQTGISDYSIHPSTTPNRLVIGTENPVIYGGVVTFEVGNIVNPSREGTHYVRFMTHSSPDGSGDFTGFGGAAYSVQSGISTQAYVPPFLIFCSALTVSLDCSSTNGAYLNLGELSPAATRYGHSQFSGATNDANGYTVTLYGTTMLSGNNLITPLDTPSISRQGSGQFGINLRANTNPAGGEDPVGSGSAEVRSGYDITNQFKFASGETVTSSALPTEFNRFTVTYIVNVPPNQPPGIYSGTYTYVAVASF